MTIPKLSMENTHDIIGNPIFKQHSVAKTYENKSKFFDYSIIKIVYILFFVTVLRILNTNMRFKSKIRNSSKRYFVALFYVYSIIFLLHNRMSQIPHKIKIFLLVQKKYIITEVILHQEFKNAEHYAPHPRYTYIISFNTISSAELLTLFISPTHFIWSVAFNSSVILAPAFICSTRSSNLS